MVLYGFWLNCHLQLQLQGHEEPFGKQQIRLRDNARHQLCAVLDSIAAA